MYVKLWAITCCLFAQAINAQRDKDRSIRPLVIGGNKADDYSFPYMASLQVFKNGDWRHNCGAVLVDLDKLVTAAHCFDKKFTKTRIRIGAINIVKDLPKNKYSQTRDIKKIMIHPKYIKDMTINDIAVIYLTEPVELNTNVMKAEIAPKGSNFEGEKCVIAGWGISEEFPVGSPDLREAFTPVLSTYECNKYDWHETITEKQICVFDKSQDPLYGARPCKGDSGGALMCGLRYRYLAGVTSAGLKDCKDDFPSIYTRVSEYKDWILST